MSWVLAGQLALGAANTVAGWLGADKAQRQASAAIDKYSKELDSFQSPVGGNVYAGMKPQTAEEEMAMDNLNRTTASALGAAGKSGARGLASIVPKTMDFATDTVGRISASYEGKQAEIDKLIASDEQRRQAQDYSFKMREYEGLQQGLNSAYAASQGASDAKTGAIQSGLGLASTALGSYAQKNMYEQQYGLGKYAPKESK